MFFLLKKEFKDIIFNAQGWAFAFITSVVPGLFLWLFPGNYNIPDAGYADLENYFLLLVYVMLLIVPALTMRAYSDERRFKTWELIKSRPVSMLQLFKAKFLAGWLYSILCIVPTLIYVVSVWLLGFPKGNIDLGQTVLSFVGVIAVTAIFVSAGLFCSSKNKNPVVSFIESLLLNLLIIFSFNLISGMFMQGSIQNAVSDIGLINHFKEINRGILHLNSLVLMIAYFLLFSFLTIQDISYSRFANYRLSLSFGLILVIVILTNSFLPTYSLDFTSDKRYSLSEYTRKLLQDARHTGTPYKVNVYLAGDLNSGFLRLQNQLNYLLKDVNSHSGYLFQVHSINPVAQYASSQDAFEKMSKKGMKGTLLTETDRDGRTSRQLIFPYFEIIRGGDTLRVNFLKNIPGNSAAENLQVSADNLEFEFADALRLFVKNESRRIAFIEGHGELPRPYVYDAEEALSKYYSVDRGVIGNDVNILTPFRVVIVAGPTQKFTEQEKYVLDQYIMRGGRVLWLIDGVYYNEEELSNRGKSVIVSNNTSLNDMLFSYGIRVNPVLLQDEQSASLVVRSGKEGNSESALIPWYFCPLLIPSPNHPITKDIALVKAPYVSSIDIIRQPNVESEVLLTTSGKTHIVKATEEVNFDVEGVRANKHYFNQPFCITAVALQGRFTSLYANRLAPQGLSGANEQQAVQSPTSKMVVVASSGIIRNELAGEGENTQVVPLGFDRASGIQFGNKDFIVNTVNWLANDDYWMQLRQKHQQLRLLDKSAIIKNRNYYAGINLIVPPLLLLSIFGILSFARRRKYTK